MTRRSQVYAELMGYEYEDRPTDIPSDEEDSKSNGKSNGKANGDFGSSCELLTGKIPSLGEGEPWERLGAYLRTHRTELNAIISALFSAVGTDGFENGKQSGWEWRKYSDGTAECWRSFVCVGVKCTGTWGGLSISQDFGGLAYPFEFAEPPVQSISLSASDRGYMLGYPCGNGSASAKGTGAWWFVRPDSTDKADRVTVNIFARGRIKG